MSYNVTIERQGLSAIFDIKGKRENVAAFLGATMPPLPDMPNTLTNTAGCSLYFIGPEHWLLRGAIENEQALLDQLTPDQAPPEINVVRVSDTLAFFSITGPDAADIMAIASPLDLHARVFAQDSITYTEAFGIKALVLRCEGGFELAIEQSFGKMIADYLSRATA